MFRAGLAEIATPFALIDGRRLRQNIDAMQAAADSIGAALRPHFKTHRTIAIARLQRDAGAIGVTVATVPQLVAASEVLGCPVLVSSILQGSGASSPELRRACDAGEVAFAIESDRSIELLRTALGPDVGADVVIELEAGCMRSGVPASDCGALAAAAARSGFQVTGIFTYPGHAYIPGRAEEASAEELAALELGARTLRSAGFDPRVISAGSTPTMPFASPGVATEYRPGTYVFGDRQQLTLGSVQRADLAVTVVATVVAIHGDRVVLDAGGKALGRDAPRWLDGYGELADGPHTPIARMYDHHAVVDAYTGPRPSVGDRLAIVPNNVNSVLALTRSAWLTDDGVVAEELVPIADR